MILIGALVTYFILVLLGIAGSDALLGLLGVLIGGALVEASRYFAAEADLRNQLRLAALEKRLEAHQAAYTLWRRLMANFGQGQKTSDVVMECQDWWDRNCIYLDAEAREAFLRAFHAASDHDAYVAAHADKTLLMDTMQTAVGAGDLILKGVALPSIGEIESKPIWPGRKSPDA